MLNTTILLIEYFTQIVIFANNYFITSVCYPRKCLHGSHDGWQYL